MSTDREAPPYLWGLLTSIVVFAIYLATLAPTTAFWDTSEYIAAAKVLGIPHPPGNPLFVILAHTFGLLPLAASYAVRINLFAAATSAAAAGLWFLVAERWLQGIVSNRWARYGAAFGGVLVGATSWSVWNQSTVNEKVYTVSLLSIALVMWLVVRWGDDEPGTHRDRWLVLIAYVLALTSTNHMMGVLALPALAVYVLWTDWRTVLRPWAIVTFWALLLAVSVNGPRCSTRIPRVTSSSSQRWRDGVCAMEDAQRSAGLPWAAGGHRRHFTQLPLAAAPGCTVSPYQ